jgi:anthranilate phosphoribosyltransferase
MNLLAIVSQGKTLSKVEAQEAMDGIVARAFGAAEIGDFLLALRSRGETVDEILGFALSLRSHARPITIKRTDLIDTSGTGGDGGQTFNISTAVALITASSGLAVAKHGNRSVSSLSGSADVYEALGLRIDSDVTKIANSIEQNGFGFLYAPHFHPAMAVVAPIRKNLGVRTVFNILGPLLNPALAKRQVLGVYDRPTLEKMAKVLRELGSTEALVVSSRDGLDEISVSDITDAYHLKNGNLTPIEILPQDYGVKLSTIENLKGGSAIENAVIIENILSGKTGAPRDIVVFNTAAALWIGGKVNDLRSGLSEAEKLIDQGNALRLLGVLRGIK